MTNISFNHNFLATNDLAVLALRLNYKKGSASLNSNRTDGGDVEVNLFLTFINDKDDDDDDDHNNNSSNNDSVRITLLFNTNLNGVVRGCYLKRFWC